MEHSDGVKECFRDVLDKYSKVRDKLNETNVEKKTEAIKNTRKLLQSVSYFYHHVRKQYFQKNFLLDMFFKGRNRENDQEYLNRILDGVIKETFSRAKEIMHQFLYNMDNRGKKPHSKIVKNFNNVLIEQVKNVDFSRDVHFNGRLSAYGLLNARALLNAKINLPSDSAESSYLCINIAQVVLADVFENNGDRPLSDVSIAIGIVCYAAGFGKRDNAPLMPWQVMGKMRNCLQHSQVLLPKPDINGLGLTDTDKHRGHRNTLKANFNKFTWYGRNAENKDPELSENNEEKFPEYFSDDSNVHGPESAPFLLYNKKGNGELDFCQVMGTANGQIASFIQPMLQLVPATEFDCFLDSIKYIQGSKPEFDIRRPTVLHYWSKNDYLSTSGMSSLSELKEKCPNVYFLCINVDGEKPDHPGSNIDFGVAKTGQEKRAFQYIEKHDLMTCVLDVVGNAGYGLNQVHLDFEKKIRELNNKCGPSIRDLTELREKSHEHLEEMLADSENRDQYKNIISDACEST